MIGILWVLRSIFLNTLGLASCFLHSFACAFGKLTSEVLTFDQLAFDEMAFRKIFIFQFPLLHRTDRVMIWLY